MSRRALALFVLLAAALAALVAWAATRPPAVPALAVQARPLVRSLIFSARVASASRVELGSTLTGRVEQVLVREGASVKPGELLLRLESDELRAALAQARASERQAAARLAGLKSSGRSAVQAGVAQADSVLQAARADLQRTQDLVARGFLSEARLDETKRAVAVAEAQRDNALAQAQANADQGTDVAQAQAQLALAQAAVAAARAKLEQAAIVAPSEARVLLRSVEPGQIVQPGRALLTLALASPVELVGQVDERYLEQLRVGQAARVRADAYPQQDFAAQVRSIAPVVDAQRGAVEVKLALPQAAPAFLREDMTLSVEVETGRRESALVVPMDALDGERESGAATLRVVRDGRVESRRVRLGMTTFDAAEVVEGLAAGEMVLLGAAPAPGARVRPDVSAAAAQRAANGGRASGEDVGSALGNAMGR
ncbi:efflux RND transporter periplasmic adaptor subunit [uncultured Piscinibacter sp.]|uniref:efflux RND transporter periplasmic adaptor subunit n=1 Tax=uncultured Piscinibacter sp. TaxID=1131835 RepID=UPI0026162890|nr:efflux RND transporter periplasmic adaptor subunit [uncultured Piscinibacter sp.]